MISAAEQEIIGIASTHPGITQEVNLTGSDFDDPKPGALWDAIAALAERKVSVHPATILDVDPTIDADTLGLLTTVYGTGIPTGVQDLADIIRSDSYRRRLDGALSLARQELAEGADPGKALSVLDAVERPVAARPAATGFLDFVNQQLPATQWVIPGLLAREDRLVLTAEEGVGKSQMLRQIAVCAAAGIHPFTGDKAPVRNVLYLDLENGLPVMTRTFGDLRRKLHITSDIPLHIWRHQAGYNLARTGDRLEIRSLIADTLPDLVIGGPIYRMYLDDGRTTSEAAARIATAALDDLRAEFGFALALEHHAPHRQGGFATRDLRPIGSSLWLRWPEFGLGMAKAEGFSSDHRIVNLMHWRGDREERSWPAQLEQGTVLPWIGLDRDGGIVRAA